MNVNRCKYCNIKVRLEGWQCQCNPEYLFCNTHRLPFTHDCKYDYSQKHKDMLGTLLIKIEPQKLERI